jgi:hypothetical protein
MIQITGAKALRTRERDERNRIMELTRQDALQIAIRLRKSYQEACWLAWSNNLVEPRGETAERVYGLRHGWFLVGAHSFNGDELDMAQHGKTFASYDVD